MKDDSLSFPDAQVFKKVITQALEMAEAAGATQAEAGLSASQGLSVTSRMRDLETLEHQQDNGLGISVYFGQRKASASTSNLDEEAVKKTVEAACNIARYTSEDPCAGLADAELMATEFHDLDLYHPWDIDVRQAIDMALDCEATALDYDARIVNSDGASVDINSGVSVYGNSHGFLQAQYKSRHSISCSVVSEANGVMQRDYWYDMKRNPVALQSATDIGRLAAERAVRRLGAVKLSTRKCPVMYVPELARGVISHFLSAISGAAQYRKASFLLDAAGTQVFPSFVQLTEDPFKPQAIGSANFDGEGVAVPSGPLVENGVAKNYLLDSYSARKLGLQSTGHASGVHNLMVNDTGKNYDQCLKTMGNGLLVTELMGHGVSNVTGDYSRGAAGFWVEDGELAYPVEEITIAANLKDMFMGIAEIGSDIDDRGNVCCGSLLIGEMTVAGSD